MRQQRPSPTSSCEPDSHCPKQAGTELCNLKGAQPKQSRSSVDRFFDCSSIVQSLACRVVLLVLHRELHRQYWFHLQEPTRQRECHGHLQCQRRHRRSKMRRTSSVFPMTLETIRCLRYDLVSQGALRCYSHHCQVQYRQRQR